MLAFSGPAAVAENFYGYKTKVPEDYWTYFKQKGVTAVVRLNKPASLLCSNSHQVLLLFLLKPAGCTDVDGCCTCSCTAPAGSRRLA